MTEAKDLLASLGWFHGLVADSRLVGPNIDAGVLIVVLAGDHRREDAAKATSP
jgi:hypothetical protein